MNGRSRIAVRLRFNNFSGQKRDMTSLQHMISRLKGIGQKIAAERTLTDSFAHSPFHQMLCASVMMRLNAIEFAQVETTWRAASDQLQKPRQGLPLSTVDVIPQDNRLTMFADIMVLPARAYASYKTGDFTGAVRASVLAIENDTLLVEHEQCDVLEYHKLQQLHNVARIHFRQGHLAEGGKVVKEALNFMINGVPPTVGTRWSVSAMSKYRPVFRGMMVHQLVSESLQVFMHYPMQVKQLALSTFYDLCDLDALNDDEEMVKQWFGMLLQYHQGSLSINSTLCFLETSKGSSTDVFRLMALIYALSLKDLPIPVSRQFERIIRILNVPDSLKRLLLIDTYKLT